ncbi:MAG: hypothetical protein OXD42_12240 [Rhodospirillaceae bacterium]|nr:hypothetical protein [Rhodospirillaceae bacterium]
MLNRIKNWCCRYDDLEHRVNNLERKMDTFEDKLNKWLKGQEENREKLQEILDFIKGPLRDDLKNVVGSGNAAQRADELTGIQDTTHNR